MPSEEMWETFFSPYDLIGQLGINNNIRVLVDVGCGYGTFLLPMSEVVNVKVIGIDIDEEMIKVCEEKSKDGNHTKIELIHGDISAKAAMAKLEQYRGQIDYVTLFNILHCEEPANLLKNVYDILNSEGRIGIIHWKYQTTPRGPSMEIRPRPEMIINWANKAGFVFEKQIELEPYHYGLIFKKL